MKTDGQMDKVKQTWSWLPQQMPGVAKLIAEYRVKWGDAWINECWRRGVGEYEPGWFWAAEGALMVGTLWDDPQILQFAQTRITRTQAMVILRPPEGVDGKD